MKRPNSCAPRRSVPVLEGLAARKSRLTSRRAAVRVSFVKGAPAPRLGTTSNCYLPFARDPGSPLRINPFWVTKYGNQQGKMPKRTAPSAKQNILSRRRGILERNFLRAERHKFQSRL